MIPTSDPTDPGELLPAVSLSSVLIPLLVLANNHQDLDPFETCFGIGGPKKENLLLDRIW